MSCEALLGSAGFFEGRVASFEVAGTLARLTPLGTFSYMNNPYRDIDGGHKVRVQKDSSDTRFTPKIDSFKQTILNTAYIKTLEIFPSARELLSVQTSASRSVKNQCCLQCS